MDIRIFMFVCALFLEELYLPSALIYAVRERIEPVVHKGGQNQAFKNTFGIAEDINSVQTTVRP